MTWYVVAFAVGLVCGAIGAAVLACALVASDDKFYEVEYGSALHEPTLADDGMHSVLVQKLESD